MHGIKGVQGNYDDMLLIRKDMNECIRGIVDGLSDGYRTVLVLSELEDFTNAEIAKLAGIPGNGKDQAPPCTDAAQTRIGNQM